MKAYPPEPLTPEERELAQLTGRLGPHGEPSPALDAKILAAAQAAVAPSRSRKSRPRWPVAMGLAASVVFAVGVAWQLRPVQQMPTVSEAPAADQEAAARAADNAAPANAAFATDSPGAASPQQSSVDTVASEPSSPAPATPVAATAPPAPPPPPAIARAEKAEAAKPGTQTRNAPRVARPAAFPDPQPPTEIVQSRSAQAARVADTYSPPPPPAPVASQAMAAPAPEAARPMADEAETSANAGFSSASDSSTVDLRAGAANSAMQKERKARVAKASASESAKESTTLDRVEVTGSRVRRTDLQVPVVDDTQLAVNDWLERVRTRYGLGDADAARQSLLLFVRDHPRETVPDDLEPLLEK